MIGINHNLLRETAEVDRRTRRPIVLQLVEGGKLLRVRLKGQRTWYTVTIAQVFHLGALNKATELRAEKKARRAARRQAAGPLTKQRD